FTTSLCIYFCFLDFSFCNLSYLYLPYFKWYARYRNDFYFRDCHVCSSNCVIIHSIYCSYHSRNHNRSLFYCSRLHMDCFRFSIKEACLIILKKQPPRQNETAASLFYVTVHPKSIE